MTALGDLIRTAKGDRTLADLAWDSPLRPSRWQQLVNEKIARTPTIGTIAAIEAAGPLDWRDVVTAIAADLGYRLMDHEAALRLVVEGQPSLPSVRDVETLAQWLGVDPQAADLWARDVRSGRTPSLPAASETDRITVSAKTVEGRATVTVELARLVVPVDDDGDVRVEAINVSAEMDATWDEIEDMIPAVRDATARALGHVSDQADAITAGFRAAFGPGQGEMPTRRIDEPTS